ncbi:protein Z-dependent protease inhibitor-like [Aulostomus maculatus]
MLPSIGPSVVGVLALLGLVCSQAAVDGPVQDLSNRYADFASRLYRSVASRTDDNIFLSPFTLAAGLSALMSATSEQTQDQLLQGLSLTGVDPQTVPDLFQSLLTIISQENGGLNLKQGVAILPAEGIQLSQTYLDLVKTKYGGNLQSLSYTVPLEAIDSINTWAQEQAGDQIQFLVTKLEPLTQLLLATAASYKTMFDPPFNSSLTQDERFYVDKYHVVMVPMMFRAGKYFLAYDRPLKAGVLKLPMADGAAMLVVFPDENVDITTIEENVTEDKIKAWIGQLKKTKLEVQLPRFLMEHSYSLRDVLQTLDITQVFQDGADIRHMGEAAGLKLTEVFHKAVVSVDESSGGVASDGALTLFSSPPPRLTINRPFLFVVYQQTTGSVLLMGRVVDPTKK